MTDVWMILVVDDEPDIHEMTKVSLRRKTWKNKKFDVVSAHSAEEAKNILKAGGKKFHVAIIDVVMETDRAGLDLCRYIRSTYASTIRVILRTGQPGVAPEEEVMDNYDIDHYLAKTDATDDRLFAAIRSCLRTAEDLNALDESSMALAVTQSELQRTNVIAQRLFDAIPENDRSFVSKLVDEDDGKKEGVSSDDTARVARVLGVVANRLVNSGAVVDFRSKIESAMRGKSMLVLLRNKKALTFTRGALAGTTSITEAAESWTEVIDSIKSGRIDLVFLDWENLQVLPEAVARNPKLLAVLLTSQPIFEEHGRTIMTLPIASAVVINRLANEEETADPLSTQELVVTAGKLISGDIFGLEKYLAWGVSVHELVLTSSTERDDACEKVVEFANECQLRRSVREKIRTLADELLMNAIWDAPLDSNGTHKYSSLPRGQRLDLAPNEEVTIRYASDGNLFAISVTDNFGGLTREIAFKYLMKCFAKDEGQIDAKAGGAGLGLYMAYLAISTFVINVDPGKRTEVVGIFNLSLTGREMASRPRSFHYFRHT